MFKGDLYHPIEVPSPTERDLRGVWVESPWSAWAVGDAGTVLHWDGTMWTCQGVATRLDALNAIWGHVDDGIWVGGRRYLFNFHRVHGGTLIDSDVEIRAIWGRGPDDIRYLCTGRILMYWTGEKCEKINLPGDNDEEWTAVAGDEQGRVYVVGPMGFLMVWDGRYWSELDTETTELLTGAVCAGPSLYVCTDGGMVREWDGHRWRTVAFSAFGGLNAVAYVDGVIWACGDRGVVIQHRPDSGADE